MFVQSWTQRRALLYFNHLLHIPTCLLRTRGENYAAICTFFGSDLLCAQRHRPKPCFLPEVTTSQGMDFM